jgi:4-amino-4-deoxy-L-arabinose transferase-like glycosyltransferase
MLSDRPPTATHEQLLPPLLRHGLIVWLLVIAVLLLCYRLSTAGLFFHDEAIFGQLAHNTLVYGLFGNTINERIVPAQLSVGPTVLLPVTAVYAVFDVGIWQSRIVPAVAGLLGLLLAAALTARLYNRQAGLLAAALVLVLFAQQRGLYGEIPALAFLLAALWCWLRASEQRSFGGGLITGLALGMMLVSKPQMLLMGPAFALALLADRFYYRSWPWRVVLGMLLALPLPSVLSLLYQASMFGWQSYLDFILLDVTEGSESSVFPARLGLIFITPSAQYMVIQLVWLVPALLLSLPDARERTARGLVRFTLLVAAAGALFWYVVLSPGWPRYGVLPYLLLSILLAARLDALLRWLAARSLPAGRQLAQGLLVLLLVGLPLYHFVQLVRMPIANRDLLAMVATLEATVPRDALIETHELPVEFLAPHRFHRPSADEHLARVRYYFLGEETPPSAYRFWEAQPDYLVVGPMGRALFTYPAALRDNCAELLEQQAGFELYRLRAAPCFEAHSDRARQRE